MPLMSPDPIHEILSNSGLVPPKSSDLKQILENHGLSVEEVVSGLSSLVRNGEKEETRLKAYDTALELHEVLGNKKREEMPTVKFILKDYISADGTVIAARDINLSNILCPER